MRSTAWPRIVGIDTDDARRRFRGDLRLYVQMLRLFFDDHEDDQRGRVDCTRLHELKGAAGTLGAKSVYALLVETERFVRAGEHDASHVLASRADVGIAELRVAAAPLLRDPEKKPADGSSELDPTSVGDLVALLLADNLAAIAAFEALTPALQARLGAAHHARAQALIHGLRFAEAAEVVLSLVP